MKTQLYHYLGLFILLSMSLSACRLQGDSVYLDATVDVDEKLMLSLVNEARQKGCKCGSDYYPPVDPVEWHTLLESAAQQHANDMNNNDFFSHKGSDRSSAGDRIEGQSYDWKTYGENIAKGQSTEQAVMDSWLASPGHCKNIMNANFVHMGVATSGPYWTQVFAAPK